MNAQGQYNSGRGRDGLGNVFTAGWTGDPPIRGGALAAIRIPGSVALKRPAHITGDPGRASRNRKAIALRRRKVSPAEKKLNRAKFLAWLQKFNPRLAMEAAKHANAVTKANGLGQFTPTAPISEPAATGWFDSFISKAGEFGQQYLAYSSQKQILDIQIARAEAGLAPLETSQLAPTIKVETTDEATRQITGAIGTGLKTLATPLVIGAVVIGGLLFLKK